jgi:hypothetical protein
VFRTTIKSATEAEKASYQEALKAHCEKHGVLLTTRMYRENILAWEWYRRQLRAQGFTEEHIEARQRIVVPGQLGTYEAVLHPRPQQDLRDVKPEFTLRQIGKQAAGKPIASITVH